MANPDHAPDPDGQRTIAYLAAYLEISDQGARFYATGIPLGTTGYLRPDRAVIKTLLQHEFLVISHGKFELTERGREKVNAAIG
jgi:hypothetical protein